MAQIRVGRTGVRPVPPFNLGSPAVEVKPGWSPSTRGESRKDTRSVLDAELQLFEILGIDGRGRAVHEGCGARRLGKRDRVANGFASVEEDDQAVQPQRDSAVRRRAVFERLQQESELLLRLFGLHPDRAHDALLDILSMDPDAPA